MTPAQPPPLPPRQPPPLPKRRNARVVGRGAPPAIPRQREFALPPVEPLDRELFARLPSLPLRARYLADSLMNGRHRSPLRGFSSEFAEHRQYQPGDELRRLDWRLWGRCDRLYVKEYEEETRLRAILVLDHSASMSFTSQLGSLTKLDFARAALAGLAVVAFRQRDEFGVALAGGDLERFLPARSSRAHLEEVFGRLDSPPLGSTGTVAATLLQLAPLLRHRCGILVASDFYAGDEALAAAFGRLAWARHEVVALHVLDRAEIDFNFSSAGRFVDLEDGTSLPFSPEEVRELYLKQFDAFRHQIESHARGAGGDYVLMPTDEDPAAALALWLAKRDHQL